MVAPFIQYEHGPSVYECKHEQAHQSRGSGGDLPVSCNPLFLLQKTCIPLSFILLHMGGAG